MNKPKKEKIIETVFEDQIITREEQEEGGESEN